MVDWIVLNVPVQIHSAPVPNRVPRHPPSVRRIVVPERAECQAGFGIGVVAPLAVVADWIGCRSGNPVAVGVVEVAGTQYPGTLPPVSVLTAEAAQTMHR
jgi:hypothetical protein